jgi:hypothetical protein
MPDRRAAVRAPNPSTRILPTIDEKCDELLARRYLQWTDFDSMAHTNRHLFVSCNSIFKKNRDANVDNM